MSWRYTVLLVLPFAALLSTWTCLAAEEPKKAAEPAPDFVVSEMRIQRLPGPSYLHVETETTLAKVGAVSGQFIPALHKTAEDARVRIAGPLIFVYQGATNQPDAPFKLSIGFPVPDDTKPVGDYKVRKLADFPCASVLFSGPMAKLRAAYGKLFPALMAAGRTPTGEIREYMLYWEAPDSPNNVILILAGIREQ